MPGMELAALAAVDTGATTAEVAEVQGGRPGNGPGRLRRGQ